MLCQKKKTTLISRTFSRLTTQMNFLCSRLIAILLKVFTGTCHILSLIITFKNKSLIMALLSQS